jgi:hypothetical protein
MSQGWLDTLNSLNALVAGTPEERAASAALRAMTPSQRVAAMWRGELSLLQLTEWSRRAPQEVPLINGEFAYITLNTVEYLEDPKQPECPVTGQGVRECRCGADHGPEIGPSAVATGREAAW